jgi:hypothetical protein
MSTIETRIRGTIVRLPSAAVNGLKTAISSSIHKKMAIKGILSLNFPANRLPIPEARRRVKRVTIMV